MKSTETKRCRNIRRVLIGIFVLCGYLLSTTFASAYIDEEFIPMTALNLAFGSMGADHPVYRNPVFGAVYMIVPLVGFLFMFFDHNSNVKNLVGIACGVIGCTAIALPLGANSELYLGIGALLSMILYMFATTLSAISIFMKLEDRRNETKSEDGAPRLEKH